MCNDFIDQPAAPLYRTRVVTRTGTPFRCLSAARIVQDGSIHDVTQPDLVIGGGDLFRSGGYKTCRFTWRANTAATAWPCSRQKRSIPISGERLLEGGISSFEEITCQVGYEDSSTFRKVFPRQTGLRRRNTAAGFTERRPEINSNHREKGRRP